MGITMRGPVDLAGKLSTLDLKGLTFVRLTDNETFITGREIDFITQRVGMGLESVYNHNPVVIVYNDNGVEDREWIDIQLEQAEYMAERRGIHVLDVLILNETHVRSKCCDGCCPPEGKPFNKDILVKNLSDYIVN